MPQNNTIPNRRGLMGSGQALSETLPVTAHSREGIRAHLLGKLFDLPDPLAEGGEFHPLRDVIGGDFFQSAGFLAELAHLGLNPVKFFAFLTEPIERFMARRNRTGAIVSMRTLLAPLRGRRRREGRGSRLDEGGFKFISASAKDARFYPLTLGCLV